MIWDLIIGLVVLFAVSCVGALLLCLIGSARSDRYEPQAAESDAALADVQRVFAGHFDADGDLLARPETAPRAAAASDLDDSKLVGEIYQAIDLYKRGGDIESGAPKEQA